MTSNPLMYIDLIRTAQILGGEALDVLNDNATLGALTDKSGGDNGDKLLFCLEGIKEYKEQVDNANGATTTKAAAAATTTGQFSSVVN